jgi:hypothetical protein
MSLAGVVRGHQALKNPQPAWCIGQPLVATPCTQDVRLRERGWKPSSTLDIFYNLLHQDWHNLLSACQGVPAEGDKHGSPLCTIVVKLVNVETTKESGTKACEQGKAPGATQSAHDIVKDLHCGLVFPVCGNIMCLDAMFWCHSCGLLVHVLHHRKACLAHCLGCLLSGFVTTISNNT